MIYRLKDNLFEVEYTSCAEPIGNMRQEMEKACIRLANNGKILISLTGGMDSQVLLHTFHTLGLPCEAAFLYFPNYNDQELKNIRILENKYNFKCNIVDINPDQHREEIEHLSMQTGLPIEHHLMKQFVRCLPADRDILQGIESFDFVFKNKKVYCLESWNSIEVASQRALKEIDRPGKIVCIDRRGQNNDFALAMLRDEIVSAYIHSIGYIKGNGLVDTLGNVPKLVFSWEYYVKPLLYGKYWQDELEYFPKYVSPSKIDFIMDPVNDKMKHNYLEHSVLIERNELISHLSDWGSNHTKVYREDTHGIKNV